MHLRVHVGVLHARFFSTYHALLCGARVSRVNPYSDWFSVAGAAALAVAPFYKQRSQFLTFGMLVVFDNIGRIMEAVND